ncbi:MAG: NAD-dependent epimerase/dehydratase family protein [Solobacterium sp.]|jgi:nucleoside-diphosphate-sugar epimerase|nr:NAD-dependent epimerase/dehydratase family protein [Solobacterium sp.]MCH4206235.1 NAD-dependent epimerase/dehydratase family protein [Solobacterium sp.]MCH4227724.1 NAD-dependent epimerase/dehydratase family protein [Solobacterium sp.]MCH4283151.1 NAD-dependent epimerase/dehydratase family protein [Solobacterium sp.]
MKNMLVTGGTVFVSRAIASYFAAKNWHVSVLNRNTREQPSGVDLIQADRHALGDALRAYHFDAVIDTAYSAQDVTQLRQALSSYGEYVLISSSAVYPETAPQPFAEEAPLGRNRYWGAYGTDKIAAENVLLKADPNAYILRPPYLYGPMNNVYREAFVFDCAMADRKFYLPQDGRMQLQFFHVDDLCRFIDLLLEKSPAQHIFNVGNRETISIREWAELCYQTAGKKAEFVQVSPEIEQRNYFSFYNYEYCLDVSKQEEIMPDTVPLSLGLQASYAWYPEHQDEVMKRPYMTYIDSYLK